MAYAMINPTQDNAALKYLNSDSDMNKNQTIEAIVASMTKSQRPAITREAKRLSRFINT